MARKKYSDVEKQIMKNVSRNLRRILFKRGVSQKELAEKSNLATSTVSDYINAKTLISPGNLQKIADALNVLKSDIDSSMGDSLHATPAGKRIMLPVIGTVKAGKNGLAYEEHEGEEAVDDDSINGGKYFYLRVKGDSMINEGIIEGDLALIREQPEVENGDLAIVLVDGEEGTLKRVYKTEGSFVLQASNSAYPPRIFSGDELDRIRIIGKVKETKRKYL